MLQKKKDVYKPPAVIHHDNTSVSLLQKKAWSWLIANAYDELETEEIHGVRVQDLMRAMEYNSKNDEYLKNSLRGLMTTLVEWDIPRFDKKNVWQAATMLAEVRIEDGICFYSFGAMFRQALYHPEVYARLSLKIINDMSSKYALNLWEMCIHAMNPKTGIGETQWWEIDEFRRMIGVKEGAYKDFRNLKKRVIQPSIEEIKLLARCNVTPEYKRAGRKITHIKFKAARIKAIEESMQQELPIDTEGLPEIVAELVKRGVHRNKAMRIWSDGFRGVKTNNKPQGNFEDYLWEKIDLLEVQSTREKIPNKGGWLVRAIENDYAHPKYQKRKRDNEIRKEIEKVKSEVKRLKDEQKEKEAEVTERLIADNDNLQAAFEQSKKQPLFKEEWSAFADNVREAYEKDATIFGSIIRLAIKDQHSEEYKEVNSFDAVIQKAEGKIQQLQAKLQE